ncbi:hypothetical protein N6H14_01015 [Paenibacillus sp. CC-CFT747]|nr:hypothetical protein N6H14_01015 [Paenibacillus sp. CC-CFT747]
MERLAAGRRLLVQGGFSKKKLRSADRGYLNRFLLETRRAEVTHWLAMAPAPCSSCGTTGFRGGS